jgi:hypothetical protein
VGFLLFSFQYLGLSSGLSCHICSPELWGFQTVADPETIRKAEGVDFGCGNSDTKMTRLSVPRIPISPEMASPARKSAQSRKARIIEMGLV